MYPMTRREFLQLVGLSTTGLIVASCAPQTVAPTAAPAKPAIAKSVPVIRLVGGDNGYPTPFAYVRGPGYIRMSFIFDQLVWKDSQGYIPWLATEWKSVEDGKRWTFTLRDSVKWQDGQPFTADDVIFTFQYSKSQPALSPLVRGLEFITEIRKTDANHVEFVFSRPYAPFLVNIAGATPIIPKHIWEKVSDPLKFTTPEALLGSGPYKLISYDKATGAYLYEANNNFFLGKPHVQRIELVPVADGLVALQQGTVDVAGLPTDTGVPDDVIAPFQKPEFGILSAPGEWNPVIHFNMSKGAPYNDVKFRQAWAYAIDRAEMVKRLLFGRGEPGVPVYLAPSNPWFNRNVEQYKFNLDKAKTLLESAGYKDVNGDGVRENPDGKPFRVPLIFDSNGFVRLAEMVRDMLKTAGIAVELKPVDRATMDASTSSGNYDVAITYYGGLGGDPDTMRQNFSSKSTSKSFSRALGYSNPRFDELADQQLATTDEAKRQALVMEMQVILAQDVPVLPIYYPTRNEIHRKAIFDNWYYTPNGIASGVPQTWNKQVFVTGQKTGTTILQ
ncbi:MAG: diguanylate phosphodiesterase [Chloroflexi bacterium]|nr:diguanylate phosphodiesterase [Chloroflexota bacterium]